MLELRDDTLTYKPKQPTWAVIAGGSSGLMMATNTNEEMRDDYR